jgi:hypothetical protein
MTEITVSLPDELARQAQQAGLLRSEALAELLRDAIRTQRVDRLFATMDKLASLEPSLSDDEIDAEIDAARKARAHRR